MGHRLTNLDLLRGLAALMVCAGHLRAFLFVDFGQVTAPGLVNGLFYFFTGLGHQAVVVFFVLSGFLVGGSVLTAYRAGRWSWLGYSTRRLTRLWIVLLPALMLTLVLDGFGRHWGYPGYEGSLGALYSSGPTTEHPADLCVTTFLGNLVFLQTVYVNVLGTNGPLWSLANEFWYYALFPLLCGVVFTHAAFSRLVCLLLFLTLIWWLPPGLAWSGVIWLLGAGAYLAAGSGVVRGWCSNRVWIAIMGAFSMGALAASKTGSILGSDRAIGLAFALWIVGLVSCQHRTGWLTRLGTGLSEISYTLYLTHFPVLAFVFFAFFDGKQVQPGFVGYTLFGGLLVVNLALAAGLWWCFERNTDRLRKRIDGAVLATTNRLKRGQPTIV